MFDASNAILKVVDRSGLSGELIFRALPLFRYCLMVMASSSWFGVTGLGLGLG